MKALIITLIIFIIGYNLGFKQMSINRKNEIYDDTITDERLLVNNSETLSLNHKNNKALDEDSIDLVKEYKTQRITTSFNDIKEE